MIKRDKILHALAGFLIGAFSFPFIYEYSFVLVMFSAIGKELYDEFKYGGFDFYDMFTTLLGGFIGIFAVGLLGL